MLYSPPWYLIMPCRSSSKLSELCQGPWLALAIRIPPWNLVRFLLLLLTPFCLSQLKIAFLTGAAHRYCTSRVSGCGSTWALEQSHLLASIMAFQLISSIFFLHIYMSVPPGLETQHTPPFFRTIDRSSFGLSPFPQTAPASCIQRK